MSRIISYLPLSLFCPCLSVCLSVSQSLPRTSFPDMNTPLRLFVPNTGPERKQYEGVLLGGGEASDLAVRWGGSLGIPRPWRPPHPERDLERLL